MSGHWSYKIDFSDYHMNVWYFKANFSLYKWFNGNRKGNVWSRIKKSRKLKQLLRCINSYSTGHILFVARFKLWTKDLNVSKSFGYVFL